MRMTRTRFSPPCTTLARLVPLGLGLILLASTSGCSCWKDPLSKAGKKPETLEEMEERRKELEEKKEEKPPFETERLAVLPTDDSPARNLVKPGHWFNAIQTSKANNYDFPRGELDAECVDQNLRPVSLPGTNFDLRTSRPVSLPKGQKKHFDVLLFASKPSRGNMLFQTHLRPRGGGRAVEEGIRTEPTTTMKPYQNYLVVLAEYSDNYQFLKSLRSVKPVRSHDVLLDGNDLDYIVKLPKGTRRIDLPTHPLAWTNIAYVIWDDFNPAILSLSQQQAMRDWLHWGGQLIVSGPRTLDLLTGSRFGELLPARAGETSSLSDDTIGELNETWSFPEAGQLELGKSKRPLTIELKLTEGSHFVANTAKLVAERRVGRGRVVVTGFAIPHEVFLAWDSFDTFFNACLMGRPSRQFTLRSSNDIILETWNGRGLERDDPRLTSQMRYFSRDAMSSTVRARNGRGGPDGAPLQTLFGKPRPQRQSGDRFNVARARLAAYRSEAVAENEGPWTGDEPSKAASSSSPPALLPTGLLGFARDDTMGVAGWNDDSDVSYAAREALGAAAGIKVPSARFIAQVLGIYLLVLVPVNWLMFRLMGRIELAWAAVPVIAIGGALGVVHVAQLDIGFARSRTEIAVVEMQPEYARGHLTRYVGLYSSLSSRYELHGDHDSTLLQPLASSQPVSNRRVALYQGDDVTLTGFRVLSNSTGMVHGEQMMDLGGPITLSSVGDRSSVRNQTDYDLADSVIVRRTNQGLLQAAWPGLLPSKQQQTVTFQPVTPARIGSPERKGTTAAGDAMVAMADGPDIRALIELATDPSRLGIGEAILVGWNDRLMPGLKVRPSAAQVAARTVFVVQLSHAVRPQGTRDATSYEALLRIKREESDFEETADIF